MLFQHASGKPKALAVEGSTKAHGKQAYCVLSSYWDNAYIMCLYL